MRRYDGAFCFLPSQNSWLLALDLIVDSFCSYAFLLFSPFSRNDCNYLKQRRQCQLETTSIMSSEEKRSRVREELLVRWEMLLLRFGMKRRLQSAIYTDTAGSL